jgi:hypothetical protein
MGPMDKYREYSGEDVTTHKPALETLNIKIDEALLEDMQLGELLVRHICSAI